MDLETLKPRVAESLRTLEKRLERFVDVLAHRVTVEVGAGSPPEVEVSRWIVSEIVDRVAIPL